MQTNNCLRLRVPEGTNAEAIHPLLLALGRICRKHNVAFAIDTGGTGATTLLYGGLSQATTDRILREVSVAVESWGIK